MIKCYLTTNIDSCKFAVEGSFPKDFVAVPQVGSRIRANRPVYISTRDGQKTIERLELYVVGVIYGECELYNGDHKAIIEPYIEIELHHPYAKEMGLI